MLVIIISNFILHEIVFLMFSKTISSPFQLTTTLTDLRMCCCSTETMYAWYPENLMSMAPPCGSSWCDVRVVSHRTEVPGCHHGPHRGPQAFWETSTMEWGKRALCTISQSEWGRIINVHYTYSMCFNLMILWLYLNESLFRTLSMINTIQTCKFNLCYKLAYTMFKSGKLEVNDFCVNLPGHIFK